MYFLFHVVIYTSKSLLDYLTHFYAWSFSHCYIVLRNTYIRLLWWYYYCTQRSKCYVDTFVTLFPQYKKVSIVRITKEKKDLPTLFRYPVYKMKVTPKYIEFLYVIPFVLFCILLHWLATWNIVYTSHIVLHWSIYAFGWNTLISWWPK